MPPFPDELPNHGSPRDHLDQVRLVVRQTTSPVLDSASITGGLFCEWWGPLAVSLEEAARHASAVAWDNEREHFEPFISNQKYTQFEWGASGYALEFAIELVNSVAVESIMLGAAYAIGKIRGRDDAQADLPGSAELLAEDALKATAAIFDVDRDDLEVVHVEIKRQTAKVLLRSDGGAFRVEARKLGTGEPAFVVTRED